MKKKYSVFSNIFYLLKLAFKQIKSLYFVLLLVFLAKVLKAIIELSFTPKILSLLENASDLKTLLITAAIFAILFFISDFIINGFEQIASIRTGVLRQRMLYLINEKFLTSSYALSIDSKFKKLFKKTSYKHNYPRTYSEMFCNDSVDFLVNIFMAVYCLFILSSLPNLLIILTVVFCLISFLINNKFLNWEYEHREELAQINNGLTYVTEISTNHTYGKDIRMFGLVDWLNDIYESATKDFKKFKKEAKKRVFYGALVDTVVTTLRNALTYYYLYRLIVKGEISASNFLLLFASQSRFSSDMMQIFEGLKKIKLHLNDLSTVREFLDYEDVIDLYKGERIEGLQAKDIEIEFKNVSFRYLDEDEYVLEDINFKLKPLEKVAIVGYNGAGKTTLIKLMMGFLEPSTGEILLNGRNLKEYKRTDYYQLFTAVFQEHSILPDSIEDNIVQSAEIDQRKLNKVLEQAGLINKVKSLHDGLDTPVSKEIYPNAIELSGGEIQRLLLARALYKDNPILILDEPTAALDPLAERSLYEKYNELSDNKTSIFISHRLASTRFCDYILFLGDKKILEQGSHYELLKTNGPYKELFDIQSQYYKEDEYEEII